MRLFVYGTLKRGFSAHDLLSNALFIQACVTSNNYHLYRIASFPGMVVGEETGGVRGELFEVTDPSVVRDLDQYEGHPYLFRRELIDLSDGSQAWAYLYTRSFDKHAEIKNGEWK